MTNEEKEVLRAQARNEYGSDEIEIDDEAEVSETGDGTGVWVAAWVYVRTENDDE